MKPIRTRSGNTGWGRQAAATVALLAAPALAALAAVPPAASAAVTHPAAHTQPGLVVLAAHPDLINLHATHSDVVPASTVVLSFANSPGAGIQLTAEGSSQAQMTISGSNLTEGNCGSQAGTPVRAFENQNGKFMKYQSSNGYIVFTSGTSNGCSNDAESFLKFSSPDGFTLNPMSDVNKTVGANSDSDGAKVFGGNPSWTQYCFFGNSGCP